MYSVINTWRLGIPVAYNFLQIMNIQNCAFLDVMGPVQEIPFVGEGINEWIFPIFLVLTVLLTLSNFFNCILKIFGSKSVFSPGNQNTEEKIQEGVYIIQQYRQQKFETPLVDEDAINVSVSSSASDNLLNTSQQIKEIENIKS